MSVTPINNYSTAAANGASTSTSTAMGAGGNSLSIDDFLRLLAAQLSNQDAMNPTNDTDFISQMAQFTSLQAMQTMTEISYAQYGASMIGKKVIVASYDENGKPITDQGVVENVLFSNGTCTVTVNGKQYDLSSITEVVLEFDDEK